MTTKQNLVKDFSIVFFAVFLLEWVYFFQGSKY